MHVIKKNVIKWKSLNIPVLGWVGFDNLAVISRLGNRIYLPFLGIVAEVDGANSVRCAAKDLGRTYILRYSIDDININLHCHNGSSPIFILDLFLFSDVATDDSADVTADDNLPVQGLRPNARRPWKLRKQKRRRNRYRRIHGMDADDDSAPGSDAMSRRMMRKQRRQNRWKNMLARKGCFCFTPEQLQALKEIITDAGREDEFPDIVPEDPVVDDADDADDDVSEEVTTVATIEANFPDVVAPQ